MPSNKSPSSQARNNQRSNALNPNYGTKGTNHSNAHAHGNRGKQLNPNQFKPVFTPFTTPPASSKTPHG